ncbi:restriction endonuclease subunit S [Escherichia fergusonii]|uniref:restriction endonuclease subunit S n=1 Tax=Escherichia fergusonii TaxID=564 RepID=UPI00200D93B8|nr:restriction endonuclease subunit S [Escherichia fergusonii]EHT2454590.1 restriction endonuclease subunit S [Escherichia fergusonii]MCO7967003.1 restriction endonuclease subunit S [Escherichia fergusonii]HCO7160588.1 restriction endonuclease subunit S [Escherichia fergusonii]
MSAGKLPEGWVITTFTELLDVQGGTQPPKSEFISEMQDGYVRLLQIRDFGNKPVPTYIPDTSKLKKCKEEDLLIGRYGASLGRICTGHAGAYNVALAKVIIPKQLERSFVRYYLESEIFQFPLRLLSRSAQNGFNKDDLSKFNFVLVPLSEQKIIAEKLDTLLAQVDSAKARLEQIPQILKRFRQAILATAMNGKLTEDWKKDNPSLFTKWNKSNIGELAQVATGKTPKRTDDRYWENGTIPWLTSSSTGKIFVENADQFISDIALRECTLKIFSPGTLLLAMYGEGKTRGQVTELKISATCNQACAAIICDEDKINRQFLKMRLMENYQETRKVAAGGNQPNLNLNKVREIPILLPSLPEQHEIVRRVEQLFAYADTIEKQVNNALARVNNLTQSILAKAFRGELTAQWRAENPDLISGENSAAALLEKIKAERAACGGKKASRKKS